MMKATEFKLRRTYLLSRAARLTKLSLFSQQKNQITSKGISAKEATVDSITTILENNDDEKQNWHYASTKLMLSLVEEILPKLGKSFKVKTKAKMYKLISMRMADEGYSYNPIQIENKFRGLERCYKRTVLNNRQNGRSRQTCFYEDELSRIFKQKKVIYPEFVLDSSENDGTSLSSKDDTNLSTDCYLKDDELSHTQISKRRSKLGVRDEVIKKMEEMVNARESFHAKILDLMAKKEERAKKREEISERKLKLL